ncbi:MAG: ABC transporter ATP-binding protein [Anaerolineales bacterium]|nr:ABC transporter ATP-binding protein [Anaerolineales bacterium]
MDELAIDARGLSKVYDKPQGWRRLARGAAVTAVSDANLAIPRGELFGLLGPNGAGKTTLVKMLCTLILPSVGAATIAGHDLRQGSAIRAAVGLVVSDERSFYWRLSARRNLLFFAAMHGLHDAAAEARVRQALAAVDLADVAERRFSGFSSGMRQRLAIARALLHQPRILFLDEPSRSLDPTATQRLHDLVRQLMAQREMTVFLITHDLAEAEKLCDRVALMHGGRIQAVGNPAALRRQLRPQWGYRVLAAGGAPLDLQPLQARVPSLRGEVLADGRLALAFEAGEGDGQLAAVLAQLQAWERAVLQIETAVPTLEEVFAHYTRHAPAAERETDSPTQIEWDTDEHRYHG